MDLIDLDIKSFDNAWTAEEWASISAFNGHAIAVSTFMGNVAGFAVFRDHGGDVELRKLAVKPACRTQGVSRLLVSAGQRFAQDKNAKTLFMVVPESLIYPGDRSLSGWLLKTNFTATTPFIQNHFSLYGDKEHGVKFVQKVEQIHEQSS